MLTAEDRMLKYVFEKEWYIIFCDSLILGQYIETNFRQIQYLLLCLDLDLFFKVLLPGPPGEMLINTNYKECFSHSFCFAQTMALPRRYSH